MRTLCLPGLFFNDSPSDNLTAMQVIPGLVLVLVLNRYPFPCAQ